MEAEFTDLYIKSANDSLDYLFSVPKDEVNPVEARNFPHMGSFDPFDIVDFAINLESRDAVAFSFYESSLFWRFIFVSSQSYPIKYKGISVAVPVDFSKI